jgi:glycosyltransferase involved in cell wall biosynthesis
MKKKRVLVLIVAYNAEKTISKLLDRFDKKTLNHADEILLADDASKDNTTKVAGWYKQANNLKKLTIVHHKINKGYGGNQKWGYNYAMKNNFDVVVMVHGDAQYPPEYILKLIKPIEEGRADFMFGSRMTGDPLKGGMPLYKFFGNKFLTFTENLILGTNLSEFHSGFRAYNVDALKQIPLDKCSDNFHFDSEIIVQLALAKKKIGEITIPTCYGDEKCNVNSIGYGMNILKILFQYLLNKFKIKKYDKFSI